MSSASLSRSATTGISRWRAIRAARSIPSTPKLTHEQQPAPLDQPPVGPFQVGGHGAVETEENRPALRRPVHDDRGVDGTGHRQPPHVAQVDPFPGQAIPGEGRQSSSSPNAPANVQRCGTCAAATRAVAVKPPQCRSRAAPLPSCCPPHRRRSDKSSTVTVPSPRMSVAKVMTA